MVDQEEEEEDVRNKILGSLKFLAIKNSHTVVLDLSIISNDTILLMISISTTFALPVTSRVSNEAKFFQKIKF